MVTCSCHIGGRSVANFFEHMVDTSYKSAATNAVTFSAMDAKKADGEIYELAYVDA